MDPKDPILPFLKMLLYIYKQDFKSAIEMYNLLNKNDEYVKDAYDTLENEISLKVRELCQKEKYKEAMNLLNLLDTDNVVILNQKISIYRSMHELLKAFEVYESIKNPNQKTLEYYWYLQNDIKNEIEELLIENELDKALSLADLLEDSEYGEYKRKIKSLENVYEEKINDSNTELNTLMTELYNNTLTWDEINDSNLEDYEIEVLKMAYCEVYKLNYNAQVLKDLKQKYQSDKKVLNILTKLLEHIKKKTFIVNFGFYENLLSCNVLFKQMETQKLE